MEYITGVTLLDLNQCDDLGVRLIIFSEFGADFTCQFLIRQIDNIVYIDDQICCC